MEHARGKRSDWAPQLWWALGQWPIWPTGKCCAVQTSIFRVFADIGPTLAQSEKANCHFVNVSPPSATDVYPLCICRHWANVGSE